MIDIEPPRGRHNRVHLLPGGPHRACVGTAEFGDGVSTVHPRFVAAGPRTTAHHVILCRSAPVLAGHRTGASGSADRFDDAAARGATGTTWADTAGRAARRSTSRSAVTAPAASASAPPASASTSSVRTAHPRPADVPRGGVLVAGTDESPEPRGVDSTSGFPFGPVVPAVADAARGATGLRRATPVTRYAAGAARTLHDPQTPSTEERLSRARRDNRAREGMEEHKA
ncbi:hypothetical protein [Kocuria nitroreducens]|uniref:hypothetical protein n=1 Tax=Kocuria nitroreducens TaxID=3058914 RepID=UPI0036D87751